MNFPNMLFTSRLTAQTIIWCWLLACLFTHITVPSALAFSNSKATSSEDCPQIDKTLAIQLGDTFLPLLNQIAHYLEQGRPVTELHTTFNHEIDPNTIGADEAMLNYSLRAWVVDLKGNGGKDVVVTIRAGSFVGLSGAFVFQRCTSGRYSIHYIDPDPQDGYAIAATYAYVIPARLRGGSSTQLIVSYSEVLSGRCVAERILVVGLEGGVWREYLDDAVGCDDRDITVVKRVVALDSDSTNRKNLMLVGDQSTGWGVFQFAHRRVRVFYVWEDNQLQFSKRVYLPSTYRFHVLRDAELALETDDLALAQQNYEKAAYDVTLKNSFSWYEIGSLGVDIGSGKNYREAQRIAGQYQMAFARFRLIVLSAGIQQPNRLESMVKQLTSAYPIGKPGSEFSELSKVFQEEFIKSGDKQRACRTVDSVIERQYPNLIGVEGHVGNWGDQGGFTIIRACPEITPP